MGASKLVQTHMPDLGEIQNYIVEVSTNQLGTDELLVKAGTSVASQKLEKEIKDHFRAKLRVAPEIMFYSPKEIFKLQFPENTRKPINFIDRRKT